MKTKTVVYVGDRPSYNLNKIESINFPRNYPITINSLLCERLPASDFEEFDPQKHKRPNNPVKPILVKAPSGLRQFLSVIPSVKKIRDFFPYHDIIVMCQYDYSILLAGIENTIMVNSVKNPTGKFYRIYDAQIPRSSAIFSGGALKVHTAEFCYKQHLRVMYGDENKIPTLLDPYDIEKKYITIVNTGLTMESYWGEVGDYLLGREWPYPVQYISNDTDFEKVFPMIAGAHYVICTGDSNLRYLAAYLGVPLFFFEKNIKKMDVYQLDFFNKKNENYVLYSNFVPNLDLDKIYTKLESLISKIVNDEPVELPKPPDEPIETPSRPTPRKSSINKWRGGRNV